MPRLGATAALSLSIILMAGSAAAVVNVQVLKAASSWENSSEAMSALRVTSPAVVAVADPEPVVMKTRSRKASTAVSPAVTEVVGVEDTVRQWRSPVSGQAAPARSSGEKTTSKPAASSGDGEQSASSRPTDTVQSSSGDDAPSSVHEPKPTADDGRDD